MQQMIFIADFIVCSACFGQYYAHNQELESIIQMAPGDWHSIARNMLSMQ